MKMTMMTRRKLSDDSGRGRLQAVARTSRREETKEGGNNI